MQNLMAFLYILDIRYILGISAGDILILLKDFVDELLLDRFLSNNRGI